MTHHLEATYGAIFFLPNRNAAARACERGARFGDLATTEANRCIYENDATDLVHAINDEI